MQVIDSPSDDVNFFDRCGQPGCSSWVRTFIYRFAHEIYGEVNMKN